MLRQFSLLILGLFLTLSACTKTRYKKVKLFSGPCKMELSVKQKGAKLLVDGVKIGKSPQSLDVPCGERQVRVLKKGYVPHISYYTVSRDQSARIAIELNKSKGHGGEDFALSKTIVGQLKNAEWVYDPQDERATKIAQLKKKKGLVPQLFSGEKVSAAEVEDLGLETEEEENVDLNDYKNWL